MTDWRIRGHPNEGGFPTEGHAIAHAWEITAPGDNRPQVYLQVNAVSPPPFDFQTRTYDAEKVWSRVVIADAAYHDANEAMFKNQLIQQIEHECFKRDMVFDPNQIEFHAEQDPVTLDLTITARATAWPKEAVQHGFPPPDVKQITVALPSEWKPLGHMNEDGITYY